MNKIFTLIVILGSSLAGWAQCTPDPSNTSALFYPDPSTLNTSLTRGVNYSELITLNIPSDTFGQTIDSVVINDITGMPIGLSHICQNSTCTTLGGSQGCVRIEGAPLEIGSFTASLQVTLHAGAISLPYSESIDLTVADWPVGLAQLSSDDIQLTVYPNPAGENATVRFNSNTESEAIIRVHNLLGAVVFEHIHPAVIGTNALLLPSRGWNTGYYVLSTEVNGQQFNQKFSIVR